MISPTSPATTTRKTTPPTVMESPPRFILARRPGRGQHEYGQAGDAGADRGACPVEVVADGWHVVPALHLHAGDREVAEVASERHDARRLRHVLPRHPSRAEAAEIDPLLEEPRDDDRRDLGVGLGAGGHRARGDAARTGEALELGGGKDALRRPVQAHEEDGRLAHFTKTHVGFSSGNAITPMSAVTAIRTGLLTLQRNRTPRLPSPTSAVSQSPIAIRPSSTHAPRIVPMAAAYAPFTKPWTLGFARCRTRTGATIRTRRKEGRKIPTVETAAPQKPATR